MPMSYHSEKERAQNPILLIALSTQYIYTLAHIKNTIDHPIAPSLNTDKDRVPISFSTTCVISF